MYACYILNSSPEVKPRYHFWTTLYACMQGYIRHVVAVDGEKAIQEDGQTNHRRR